MISAIAVVIVLTEATISFHPEILPLDVSEEEVETI